MIKGGELPFWPLREQLVLYWCCGEFKAEVLCFHKTPLLPKVNHLITTLCAVNDYQEDDPICKSGIRKYIFCKAEVLCFHKTPLLPKVNHLITTLCVVNDYQEARPHMQVRYSKVYFLLGLKVKFNSIDCRSQLYELSLQIANPGSATAMEQAISHFEWDSTTAAPTSRPQRPSSTVHHNEFTPLNQRLSCFLSQLQTCSAQWSSLQPCKHARQNMEHMAVTLKNTTTPNVNTHLKHWR